MSVSWFDGDPIWNWGTSVGFQDAEIHKLPFVRPFTVSNDFANKISEIREFYPESRNYFAHVTSF